ncbi:PQQ-dependent sugar dehydrogenase [Haloarcula montana]|uniref:PQQ-dependent sugar dehydrogenase n=1 Tax=Haloarcula montana TaxID=3111776 RepID=UPI002D771629|nr:PQQ-dependent sugar dehydrogenase [Haloarcula sp. GH36]
MTDDRTRRRYLAALAGVATVGIAGCTTDSGGETPTGTQTDPDTGTGQTATTPTELPDAVGLDPLTTALSAPLDVVFPPDIDARYIAQQEGVVARHGPDGLASTPFLDLRDAVTTGGEKGVLGLALHPEFEQNRRFYVRYSAPGRPGLPSGYSHTFVLSEFRATDDGTRARRDSERTLLEIHQPQSNHNAGSIAFGPGGYLYVGVGDGGAGGDQGRGHVEDWYDGVGGGNGQDVTENLLGSILRIDVDNRDDGQAYAIPEDNPLVGRSGLDEQYAWGLRNPWRFSFDGSDLFVGDVGQGRFEEVDLVERGGNYGWNVREGTHCYQASECPNQTPDSVRGGEPLRDPIVEYPHEGAPVSGISVIGGHVYRGDALPSLDGRYVFGDYVAQGRLFVASRPAAGQQWPTTTLPVREEDTGKLAQVRSFGRDADGELYVVTNGESEAGLHRIVPA